MVKIIFVFGSNLGGIHGCGSALEAKLRHGAKQGVGVGRTGDAYAIPTRTSKFQTLPIGKIADYVEEFKEYAREHPELEFHVVKVGCGRAGIREQTMKQLFQGCPPNCRLPGGWG